MAAGTDSRSSALAEFGGLQVVTATELANYTNQYANDGFYQYKWWYCNSVRSAIWRK